MAAKFYGGKINAQNIDGGKILWRKNQRQEI
jgi:hypothetical protein